LPLTRVVGFRIATRKFFQCTDVVKRVASIELVAKDIEHAALAVNPIEMTQPHNIKID
jgi:hypothetical protein